MGMDLINRFNESFCASWSGYRYLLNLAYENSWKPAGTLAPDFYNLDGTPISVVPDDEWDGRYFSNDYQSVSDEDALSIAEALDRAIIKSMLETNNCSPAKVDEKFVREFADFCRRGLFSIG